MLVFNLVKASQLFLNRTHLKSYFNFVTSLNRESTRLFTFATMSEKVKIATHDGKFHCDEALACFLLKLLPRYKDAEIVRSRNNSILDACDIVVDVGSVYDHSKHRYDHHMRDFAETFTTVLNKPGKDFNVKLSSAGLIYCHFGQEIIRHMLPESVPDRDVNIIFERVYRQLIKEIDCIDNGIPMHSEEPLYRIRTDISSRVDRLNPNWNSTNKNYNEMFLKAVELVGEEFLYFVNETATVWLPAMSIVRDSIEKRFEIDPSGEIIYLPHFVPWIEQLLLLEEELNISPSIKYAIFEADNSYRVRAVPVAHQSFIPRKPLPEAWAGTRDEKLQKICGVKDAVFVHSVQFIGGTLTKEGAMEMAKKSLAM